MRQVAVVVALMLVAGCGNDAEVTQREAKLQAAEKALDRRAAELDKREALFKRAEKNGLTVSDQAKLDAYRQELSRVTDEVDALADQLEDRENELDDREAALEKRENPPTINGDGVYKVGDDIDPGEYKTAGTSETCYYAILRSSDTSDIVDNNNVKGPARVTLSNGQYFETARCGTWELVVP